MTSDEPAAELVRLRPGVFRARTAGDTVLVTHRAGASLGPRNPAELALLDRLAAGPVATDTLDPAALPLLEALRVGGWLAWTRTRRGVPCYTVVPHRSPPEPAAAVPAHVVLSRFAVLRRDGADLLLEHPDAWCRILVHDPALLTVLGEPAGPASDGGDRDGDGGGPPALGPELRRDLWRAGMLVLPEAEQESGRRQWSVPERWLQQTSRLGDHHLDLEHFAGTSWGEGVLDPLPARHPGFPGPALELHRPDLARLATTDPPLTQVLEQRRSRRRHDDAHPITVDQLGELLYRCARNRKQVSENGLELLSRPYPSGGALYELELYPVVRQVTGLAAGIYHYDPQQHRLVQVAGPDRQVRRLLATAARSAGVPEQPQLLLVVAARFGRVMWKYEQIGYTLVLKHVGVLYQTVYSVATAMGLAVCGLGTGDSDAFAAATGLDPWQESSVGELMLGSSGEEVRD